MELKCFFKKYLMEISFLKVVLEKEYNENVELKKLLNKLKIKFDIYECEINELYG